MLMTSAKGNIVGGGGNAAFPAIVQTPAVVAGHAYVPALAGVYALMAMLLGVK